MKTQSNRHKATIIEVYSSGSAAAQFASGRVEHILRRGMAPDFVLGMQGMVDYVRTINGYAWTFVPYKKQRDAKSSKDVQCG